MDKQKDIEVWSKLYGKQITEEEYRKICNNLSGFLKTLRDWDRAENKETRNF